MDRQGRPKETWRWTMEKEMWVFMQCQLGKAREENKGQATAAIFGYGLMCCKGTKSIEWSLMDRQKPESKASCSQSTPYNVNLKLVLRNQ